MEQAKQEARQNAAEATRWAGVASVEQAKKENQPWWKDTLNWIDKHQGVSSIGVGAIVGTAVAAIALSVVTVVSLPIVLAVAATAAVAAGLVVLAGTYGLNTYYGRPGMENVIPNILAGSATAFVVAGAGFALFSGLITQTILAGGNAIGALCTANPQACTQIAPIIDNFEQGSLAFQLAIQKITGDEEGAAETYLQYQSELLDGGVPGNTVATESADLGDDIPELVAEYGDEIIPLLLNYGDDAVDIISKYGNDGIEILQRIGEDPNAIRLIKRFDESAIELLKTMDVTSADNLLSNLEPDVLEYAIEQGPDALDALSRWKPKELEEFGMELAMRSKRDAQVMEDISKLISLGQLDPKKPTPEQKKLIQAIAENSMQYTENGQIVLGKWVDYGNGFTKVARETGSVHYNPHPDMWEMFGAFGDTNREEAAWLVNQQVIQIGVNRNLPFEYTLEGIPNDKIELDESAIEIIWRSEENRDVIYTNIKDDLGIDVVPVRVRELVELYLAGYTYSLDALSNSYVFIK